jgi:hypothetical protein
VRRADYVPIGVIVASVLAVAFGLGYGSAAEPEPGPTTTTTAGPPLPTEAPPQGDTDGGGADGEVGTGVVTEETPVRITGIGELTVGLALAQVEELTGLDFEEDGDGGCRTATPVGGLEGVELLVVDDAVRVVDLVGGGYETLSGIGIGATEQAVLDTYAGQIEQAEDSLTFVPRDPSDAQFRIVFRTEGGAVTSFAAGLLPEVVEGCG